MKLVVKNEDRKKLIGWLMTASYYTNDNDEINETLQRLYREEEYYKNFNSPEYFDYKENHSESIEIDGQVFDKDYFNKWALEMEKERYDHEEKAKALIVKTDHTKAVNWVIANNYCLDNDKLAYSSDKELDSSVKSLYKMFNMYINYLAKDKDKHIFDNDEIDDWYFNNYNTDKRFEKIEHHFPEEIFILKYKNLYWKYRAVHGQGSWITIKILSSKDVEDLCKYYGLIKEKFEDKVYNID